MRVPTKSDMICRCCKTEIDLNSWDRGLAEIELDSGIHAFVCTQCATATLELDHDEECCCPDCQIQDEVVCGCADCGRDIFAWENNYDPFQDERIFCEECFVELIHKEKEEAS